MMKLVKVNKKFYDMCKERGIDKELLINKNGRPCVLLVKLKYKGIFCDFVIPLRSNISEFTPLDQYFPLPPNPKTKPKNHHGIHYIKLFPITKQFVDKYIADDDYYKMIYKILDKNEKTIIDNAQRILNNIERGYKNKFTPNIDGIIEMLREINSFAIIMGNKQIIINSPLTEPPTTEA